MSTYSPPAITSIDLSSESQAYTVPAITSIDLTGGTTPVSDPEGVIDSTLEFSVQLFGAHQNGVVSANLGFDASLAGLAFLPGQISATLALDASISGSVIPFVGQLSAGLGFSSALKGFQDWTAATGPLRVQEFYTLTITGSPDIQLKISSWQATYNLEGRSSYLQAVIPAAADLMEAIEARQSGRLIISKGFVFDDASQRSDAIIETSFDNLRFDRGPTRFTVTVSGREQGNPSQKSTRRLTGIRSVSSSNSQLRVRSDVDLFFRPGMTADIGDQAFEAGSINYFVSENDKFMEVSQR